MITMNTYWIDHMISRLLLLDLFFLRFLGRLFALDRPLGGGSDGRAGPGMPQLHGHELGRLNDRMRHPEVLALVHVLREGDVASDLQPNCNEIHRFHK